MSERLRDYQLLRRLGAGGMGEVFLARSASKGTVVVKRVLPHLASDARFIGRFLEEAKLAARVHHPNVVRTLELGEENGTFFIVMEHVAGADLRRLLSAGRWPPALACHVARHAALGLHAAHQATTAHGAPLHLVHADVSPHNVLVSELGEVKVIDFGVARAVAPEARGELLLGKYAYLSPEQAEGEPLEPRSDLFSLGSVLYELLTGRAPFDAPTDAATLLKLSEGLVPAASSLEPALSPELDRQLARALSKSPTQRHPTLAAFADALEEHALGVDAKALATFVAERLG